MNSKKKPSDHAVSIIKAGISGIPMVGGPLASLINDYIPSATKRSISMAMEELKRRVEKFEERVDVGNVSKDEFSDLFKSCYLVIIRTSNEEKLRAAAALMANLLLREGDKEKLSYTELDHFVRTLDKLSVGALEVLGRIYRGVVGESESTRTSINFGKIKNICKVEDSLLMGLVGELSSANLLHQEGIPQIRVPNSYDNYSYILTELGRRFVERLLDSQSN